MKKKNTRGRNPLRRAHSMICLIVTTLLPLVAGAAEYPYKATTDFRPLASFNTVEEFEKSIDKYTKHCLDNTGGGTGGIQCFVAYDLWDRELNTYYNKLMEALGNKEKELLKESQRTWIKGREKTIDFNSALLDRMEQPGTMGALMRAGDANRLITPVVRQRALLLKEWWEFTAREKRNK